MTPKAGDPQNTLPGNAVGNDGYDGLFYRAATSVAIALKVDAGKAEHCKLKTLPVAQSVVAVVPDSSQTYVMPSTAGAFATTTLNFSFKDGMPTTYSSQRPSERLAFLSIPPGIEKAIISVPTQRLQLRVIYDTQSTAQINAQTDALKARLQLLQAQQALDAAKQTTTSKPGN